MFDIEENLKQLPALPGVYIHKDSDGEVIYVGKASSLRNRVRQYFRPRGQDAKTAALAARIAEFEYIVTKTEAEALLLENTLIKRHRPRYNIMLRDDKTYPYIKITLAERWPRLLKTRVLAQDGSKYFGPYADVGAVNRIVGLLNDVYRLKRCRKNAFPKSHRPCLQGHIGRCRCVCVEGGGEGLHDEYMADINKIVAFLKGHSAEVERYIAERMHEASERLEYEDAARWRDYLEAARAVTEKQRVELLSSGSMDIVLSVSRPIEYPSEVALPASGEGGEASGGNPDARAGVAHTVTVFFVRDGKLVGRERHMLDSGSGAAGDTEESAVAAFVSQYYANQSQPPKTILLERHIPDEQLLADALSDSAGYKVKITVPERGAKRDLVKLAQNDVGEAVRRDEKRREAETKKRERLGEQFADIFGEGFQARRVEAYDISHTGGADSVGAMVAFADGKPDKSAYRRFRIRGETRGDDYAAMQETLYRRLRRAIDRDKSFLPLPDLILIDGGKGHVAAAAQVIGAMAKSETNGADIEGIRLAGMVKDERHRTRALVVPATGDFEEYSIDEKRELLQLAAAIQEEVHRFAIEYHRKRRSKRMVGEE